MRSLLENTLFMFRLTYPTNKVRGALIIGTVNTCVRLAALWLTIVVARHALKTTVPNIIPDGLF